MVKKYKCSIMERALRILLLFVLLLHFPLSTTNLSAQTRTRGIDVSKFQGTINWTKVAKDSTIKFVYVKATEGTSIRDPYYKTNITKAKKAGLLVGSYHLYSSKTTAYQQMANMRKMIKKSEQDLVPVLDIEGHHSGRLYMKRVDKLLELMESEYGVKPMIYTRKALQDPFCQQEVLEVPHFHCQLSWLSHHEVHPVAVYRDGSLSGYQRLRRFQPPAPQPFAQRHLHAKA